MANIWAIWETSNWTLKGKIVKITYQSLHELCVGRVSGDTAFDGDLIQCVPGGANLEN